MILKVLVGIPLLRFTKFLVRVCNMSKMGKEILLITIFKTIASEEREA